MTEEEQEVRWIDQEKINEFGCLNNKLNEILADLKQIKEDIIKLEDATTELSLLIDGKFMILMGEAFLECSEDYVNEYCEQKIEVRNFLFFLLYFSLTDSISFPHALCFSLPRTISHSIRSLFVSY